MLGVAALEIGHPLLLFVFAEADDPPFHAEIAEASPAERK